MLTNTNSYILTFDYNCYNGLVINNNTINRVLEEMSHRLSTNKTKMSHYFQEWFLSLEVSANVLSKKYENRVISGGPYKL